MITKTFLRIATLLFLYLLTGVTHSRADTCFTTFEQDSAKADIIFVGKVIGIDEDVYWTDGTATNTYTFEIIESFKGLYVTRSIISVLSPWNGCCRPRFKMDSTFLVFAYGMGEYNPIFYTNDCSLTGPISGRQQLYKRLDKGIKPRNPERYLEVYKEYNKSKAMAHLRYTDSLFQRQVTATARLETLQQENQYLWVGIIVALLVALIFFLKGVIFGGKGRG